MSDTPDAPKSLLQERFSKDWIWSCPTAKCLAKGQSRYQSWEVWQTPDFGRLYRLDGCCMATEADEFLCHEPLVHLAGLAHGSLRRALVLGGGDGASARELLRYPCIEEIVVAELDEMVVDIVREYLPILPGGAFDDKRVKLVLGDAHAYVHNRQIGQEGFDIVIFDLTEPESIAAALFSRSFLIDCQRLLRPGGTLCLQLGSPFFQSAQCARLYQTLCQVFARVQSFSRRSPRMVAYGRWLMPAMRRILAGSPRKPWKCA